MRSAPRPQSRLAVGVASGTALLMIEAILLLTRLGALEARAQA